MRGPASEAATRKQEALWFLERLVPGSGANNLSVVFRVDGRLRADAVERTVALLLRRYEVLRTVFTATDTGLTKRLLDPAEVGVGVQQIEAPENDVDGALQRFVSQPFEIEGGPLVRVGILPDRTGDICCLAIHHLVFDAISVGILLPDFVAIYDAVSAGEQAPEELSTVVPVFVEPPPAKASVGYWLKHLDGFDSRTLDLAIGKSDVARPTLVGGQVGHTLAQDVTDAVRALQRELRAPEAVILYAAFYLLLIAHGAGRDLVVGSPVNTRRKEEAGAIGYHVNVAPIRATVAPEQTFRQFVLQTRNNFLEAIGHATVSLDDFSSELPRNSSSWRDTILRHLFNYVSGLTIQPFTIGGMPAKPVLVENGYSKFDLEFFVVSGADTIWIRAVYYTEILGEGDAALLLQRYETLLRELAANVDRPVGDVPVWSERDRAVIGEASRSVQVAVRDPNGYDLPIGVRGELFLIGAGGRDIATGMPARWRADGTMELLGDRVTISEPAPVAAEGEPEQLDERVEELVALWRELLNKDDLDAEANFFANGGHSLLAAQLAQKVGDLTGTRPKLADVFAQPTPIELAAFLRTMAEAPA